MIAWVAEEHSLWRFGVVLIPMTLTQCRPSRDAFVKCAQGACVAFSLQEVYTVQSVTNPLVSRLSVMTRVVVVLRQVI